MPIKFKLVERKDWSKDAKEGDKLFYAQPVGGEIISFEELCESIAEETALTSADVKACFDRCSRHMSRHLKEGRSVRMGEIGTFRPVVGSKGAKTKEEFQVATMMKKPSISFIPGKMIQEAREKISFTRVKDPDETKADTPDTESPDEV
ncbi:HU family DNA-binding protein [Parabacteroides sp.]|uniref:HU family DNA-binding protein n=1 Tax=Parabacteroides sp. TaxID=1869337 RepID=UPI00257AB6FC|nr:HU family DNA-binding protein [Parabacteroides sp.]